MVIKVSQIQDKGQITIPKEAREKFGLRKGDIVQIEVSDEAIRVLPANKEARVKRINKSLNEVGKALKEEGVSYEEYLRGYQRILDNSLKKKYPNIYKSK